MAVAGLIFSNIHDSFVPELTAKRTMASVPFGCRYRLIDFPLSNMVNAGITKVGVITHNNYQSLIDHIGTGKDWDLARRSGGIKILPPFITAYDTHGTDRLYSTRLEALMGVTNFISRCTEDYMVLSDCDAIFNIDLDDVLRAHIENEADLTVVTTSLSLENREYPQELYKISSDEDGRVSDIRRILKKDKTATVSTNLMVVGRLFLLNMINDAASRGYTDFYRDVIKSRVDRARIFSYDYRGKYIQITSLRSYYEASMDLLDSDTRAALFNNPERPVHTKVRNSAPTRYAESASVKNSYVADGCVIEGTVENSVLFRGVRIGKGTVVKNCVLMQDTTIGSDVSINCIIADKNVKIRDGIDLLGHGTMPFFLAKGSEI